MVIFIICIINAIVITVYYHHCCYSYCCICVSMLASIIIIIVVFIVLLCFSLRAEQASCRSSYCSRVHGGSREETEEREKKRSVAPAAWVSIARASARPPPAAVAAMAAAFFAEEAGGPLIRGADSAEYIEGVLQEAPLYCQYAGAVSRQHRRERNTSAAGCSRRTAGSCDVRRYHRGAGDRSIDPNE